MLEKDEALLVFIDVQGHLHEVMDGREALDANLERLVRGVQLLNLPMLATEQIPEKLGPTSEPFRAMLDEVTMVAKSAFSCCGDLKFLTHLRTLGKRQVILAGIEAHVCVYQTAMDLLKAGYEVFIAADAVSSRSAENKSLALQALHNAGAVILPVESILFALLGDAADPKFREMLKLIK